MHRKSLIYAVIVTGLALVLPKAWVESYPKPRWQQGLASWYGKGFAGRQTASGERFSPQHLTAAHRDLPLGTKVVVKNPTTQAQVEVKINDSGPFVNPQRCIIDLSRAAADSIGILDRGVGPVEVVITEEAHTRQNLQEEMGYEIQVGAFAELQGAAAVVDQLQGRFPGVYVAPRDGPLGRYYRVRIGPFRAAQEVKRLAMALQREGQRIFVDEVPSSSLWAQHQG
jgi:peptidoglycan lytic transglycosylase